MVKKSKKTKAKPVSLGEFLGADSNLGGSAVVIPKSSWGDDTEDFEDNSYATERIVLPTAPRQARGVTVDMDRIPSNPPYMAYVGNLPFEVEDIDIHRFFEGIQVKNIRLPRDGAESGRFKGFGYVEFETKNDLIEALSLHEELMKNRKIRVDIADEESGGGSRRGGKGGEEREDRSGGVSDWRAAKPDSFSSDRSSNRGFESKNDDGFSRESFGERERGGGGFRDRRDNFDRDRRDNFDRDRRDNYDRGSRFGGGGGRFESRGGGRYDDRRFRDSEDGERWSRDDRSGSGGGRFRDSDDSDRWRRGRSDRTETPDKTSEPKERPRLNLQPRSKPKEEKTDEQASSKSAIFGSAKPVDTSGKLLEIEKKFKTEEPSLPEPPPKREPVASKDIFGAAKPVDTAAREKEIEAKLHGQDRSEPSVPLPKSNPGKYVAIKKKPASEELDRNSKKTSTNGTEPRRLAKKTDEEKKDKSVVLDTANKFADLDLEDKTED